MESSERGEQTPKAENGRWNYPYFREYLLAAVKDERFLLRSEEYPIGIELSRDWNETLDQMRRDSQDGIERLALVGFKVDQRAIFLPTISTKGSREMVSAKTKRQEMVRAMSEFGITDFIGNIHSHPRQLEERLWGLIRRNLKHKAIFSPADLYEMVTPNAPLIKGLVEGNENLFVFRAKESKLATGNESSPTSSPLTQESFVCYWVEKSGFRYFTTLTEPKQHRIEFAPGYRGYTSLWDTNRNIGYHYKLVFYKGEPGKNLVKVSL